MRAADPFVGATQRRFRLHRTTAIERTFGGKTAPGTGVRYPLDAGCRVKRDLAWRCHSTR